MKASRAASARGEDGAMNYNPFARVRLREPSDVENQAHRAPRLEAVDANASPLDKLPEADEARGGDENVELVFRTERELALKRRIPFIAQVRVVLGAWVNLLFVFVPAGFAVNYTRCSSITIFCINFIAIMPSATTLGFAINELEYRIGDKMSALLHMTFG